MFKNERTIVHLFRAYCELELSNERLGLTTLVGPTLTLLDSAYERQIPP